MSSIDEEKRLRDDINNKLAKNDYLLKLKSVKIRKYKENLHEGHKYSEVSYEFERGYFSETEITQANLFVSRLAREF